MTSGAARSGRLDHLDGLRALAALYVVLNHVWFTVYEAGRVVPTGIMRIGSVVDQGHFAVAAFVVVSGYSLSLSTARRGDRLPRGTTDFLRRRFWRIVPPYWAALGLSVVLGWTVLRDPTTSAVWRFAVPFSWNDVLAHVFLLQDVWNPGKINYVLWSIAIEWHIYFIFPVFLLLLRRVRRTGLLTGVAVLLTLVISVATGSEERTLVPQMFLSGCFLLGVAACRIVERDGTVTWRARRFQPAWLAIAVALVVVAGAALVSGLPNALADTGVGASIAALLVALGVGRGRRVRILLGVRPLVVIGGFSYSLYLVHPLVVQGVFVLVQDRFAVPMTTVLVLLAVAVPLSVAGSWLFFLVAERPFLVARNPFGPIEATEPSSVGGRESTTRLDV